MQSKDFRDGTHCKKSLEIIKALNGLQLSEACFILESVKKNITEQSVVSFDNFEDALQQRFDSIESNKGQIASQAI